MPTRPPRAYPGGQRPTPRPRISRPSPHAALYATPEWKAASKAFRTLYPRCCCTLHQGKPDAPKSECVDHVTPHHGDPAKFWNRSNWRAMAWRCHAAKTNSQDGGFGNPVRSHPRP